VEAPRERAELPRWAFPAFLALFFAAWTLRATVLYTIDESLEPELARPLYSLAVKALLWAAPAFAYARLAGRSPLRDLGLATLPDRASGVRAAALSVLYGAAIVLSMLGRAWKSTSEWPRALVSVAVSPLFEEILFRGLVLQEFSTRMRFWLADLASSALFVLAHWPYWLSHGGLTREMLANSAAIFALSLFLGWLRRSTGSLWPCVFMHVLNNFLAAIAR
jgi:membrane protease YdiL (CAAX protease family)